MRKWTEERAFETIRRADRLVTPTDTPEQKELMLAKFVHITVFGNPVYNGKTLQIWEDNEGNIAYFDRLFCEACIVYSGLRHVVDKGTEC